MDLNLKFESKKPERVEMYDFKNKVDQQKFKKLTSDTTEFSDCFSDGKPLMSQVIKWRNILEIYFKKSFRKIRIRNKKMRPLKGNISKLSNKRNELMKKCDDPETKANIEELCKLIAGEEAEQNRAKIMENFKHLSEDPEEINIKEMWKLFKKLWPKSGVTVPTAKRNHKGKIVTGPREIRNVLTQEYKERLRSRPVRPDLQNMNKRKNLIFKMKMKLAENNSCKDWTMYDLERALSNLKNNKSRDFEGLS